ncbi:MAG TPA: selenocysteine-specific translation elongation factor, partial [Vicinamibacterales bacterium]|nr:selenocysteine-specific translation elongation factor [Vicinamibacterales bacterium]
ALTGTDPDRLKEEKARGITIDLGFAHYQQDDLNVAFVDVPGHERFVRNMLAGAGGFDAVLLVVAADESVMPQTREHFAICRMLGLSRGVVALTKSDLADADMRAVAESDVRELAAGSFLEGAEIVAVSSRTGEGLDAVRAAIARLAEGGTRRPATGPVRLPIDRAFTVKGFGTVVTGTLVSGTLEEGREYALLPAGRTVRVRGLQSHGEARKSVEAGNRLAVNLGGIDLGDIQRGDTIAVPDAFTVTRRFDAVIENDSPRPIRNGARVRVYQGTSEAIGRITLGAASGETAADTAPVAELEPGHKAFARLRLDTPVVLTRGDRLVLRSYSPLATIGGGIVIDPAPRRAPVRSAKAAGRFGRLAPAVGGTGLEVQGLSPHTAVLAMVEEAGVRGLMVEELTSRAGVPRDEVQTIAEAAGKAIVRLGERLVGADVAAQLEARVLQVLSAQHAAAPLSEGLPREELRERALPGVPHDIAAAVLARLEQTNRIAGRERLALAGHTLSMTPEEARVTEGMLAKAREAGYQALDAQAMAVSIGAPAEVVQRMAALLVRQKQLVRLETLLYHPETLAALKADVKTLGSLDVAVFKTRYGVTRKFAIPLLEYLDRERVTRRVGDTRQVI